MQEHVGQCMECCGKTEICSQHMLVLVAFLTHLPVGCNFEGAVEILDWLMQTKKVYWKDKELYCCQCKIHIAGLAFSSQVSFLELFLCF